MKQTESEDMVVTQIYYWQSVYFNLVLAVLTHIAFGWVIMPWIFVGLAGFAYLGLVLKVVSKK